MGNTEQMSTIDLLNNVNKAIEAITVGGQSYTIGSRTMTRADLNTLNNMRKELQEQIANNSTGSLMGGCYVAEFDGR